MIIVISAKQVSGKSTLANALCRQFGPVGALKTRFAQPIYEMHDACRAILQKYGITSYDYTKKDGPLLQMLGTNWARMTIMPDIWVRCLHNAIHNSPKNIVHIIEDCRFKNEFDSFENINDVIRIRLNCPEEIRKKRAKDNNLSWREEVSHQSEIDLDGYAEDARFDMYFQTHIESTEEIVEKIMHKVRSMQAERAKDAIESGPL